MPIKVSVTGLEEVALKTKEAAKSFVNTQVPLGKTVLITTLAIGITEFVVFRKLRFTLILTRKYS